MLTTRDTVGGGGDGSWGKKNSADWKGLWPELGVLPLNQSFSVGSH